MKIFISWSGPRSHEVAKLLKDWIQCVIQASEPWLSSDDIDKGSIWFNEITNTLASTQHGIVCLTKENIDRPWILFESGALTKGLSTSRVFTFLADLEPKDIRGPLAQFNHTSPKRESVYRLIVSINKELGDKALKDAILQNAFDTYWLQLEDKLAAILEKTLETEITQERPREDLISEILYTVRSMDKRLRLLEDQINIDPIDSQFVYMRKLLSTPIEDLELSIRAYNILKGSKLNTLGDIVRHDTHELFKYRNFGKKSLIELEELLQSKGLTFGMDISRFKL